MVKTKSRKSCKELMRFDYFCAAKNKKNERYSYTLFWWDGQFGGHL